MRIANITVIEYEDITPRQFTLSVELLSDEIKTEEDLVSAMRKACTDFVSTETGKRIYSYNCRCFNWADAEAELPDYFCAKYGFKIRRNVKPEMDFSVNWDEHLVNDEELEEEENA